MSDPQELQVTKRSKLRRLPKRGSQERELIYSILDEALVAHVGFITDNQPFVIPMAYGRTGDRLYLHGSSVSRLLKTLEQGVDVCFTVTLLDGLVIARSLFHHSMNYRSVVLFGKAKLVVSETDKMAALRAFTEQMLPGRWEDARLPNSQELKATNVLSFSIEEGSAKVRTGHPSDDAKDYALPIWAGQLPLNLTAGTPIPDSQLSPDIILPENLTHYGRGR
ncbi:putative flavin-nucleotide-binding protein [Hyella patelloides LEGE 07179]|uniref:Putative flavin-nucleotide-binding protein n=1 Tax=Hyella patelloides LEGE 07179 TaxID=945734 RepID=A0A563W402_9CYAN|nr:pyridoxamine 5'-phosphate oxidase family protein [Hyella patelloides]VEP18429.1 putative flavin-nucleotide-binding protein [Hyella patelloides LEGE 07179]